MGKKLMIFTFSALLAGASVPAVYAAEPPANDPTAAGQQSPDPETAEPGAVDDAPYPPDGVTDPDVVYPTDGTEGTDQGEFGAEAPKPEGGGNDAPD